MTVAAVPPVVDAGDRAVAIINNLTHTKGVWSGEPFELRSWQEDDIIRPLFGTLRPDGTRQYRTAYIEMPRKNGKTELAAAIALYMLVFDGEQGGEVYGAATDREQASIVFDVAAGMVRNDPRLSAECEVIASRRRIVHHSSQSVYRALPADVAGGWGFNASSIIYDELHAAPNRDLWDVLTTSTGARQQPLTFVITTAGWDRNTICWELHRYAEQLLDGTLDDPAMLPVIYSAPEDADWSDEDVWARANPALSDFRSLEEMRESFKRASAGPGAENIFRRLYLCQWTEQAERWLDMGVWDDAPASPAVEELLGRTCYGGLDLASTRDLSALTLVFPDDVGGYDVLVYYWIPEEEMHERVRRDRVPYDRWVAEEMIKTTPGNVTDYDTIREDIRVLAEKFDIREVAYDRWNATQITTQLTEDGATMVPFGQGFSSMAAPTKEIERLLLSDGLRHGQHPVLRWNAANVAVAQDPAGNIKIDKAKSTEKVDGMVALAMALGRAVVHADHEPVAAPQAFVFGEEDDG